MQRIYLSDSDPDYKYLEEHLASGKFGELPDKASHKRQLEGGNIASVLTDVLDRNPGFTNSFSSDDLDKLQRELAAVVLPTRYDSPTSYRLIDGLVKQLKETASEIGINAEDFPLYATVPTGEVNAMAIKLPCASKPFLLFDGQLLTFCHLISKIYATCLILDESTETSSSVGLEAIKRNIDNHPEIASRLSGILDAFIKTGRPGTSKPFPVDMKSAKLVHDFCRGMELFVVAHEFGHVYAGHLSELLSKLHMIAPSQAASIQHKREYEADAIALILTISTLRKDGYDLALSIVGVKLFFSALDLVERYADFVLSRSKRKFSSKESETHPSNENRKKSIDAIVESIDVPADELNTSKMFSKMIDGITDLLWLALTVEKNKPGRNDPCHCGSGKKHKKCCMA